MTIEERNAYWDGSKRTFIQLNSRSTTPRFWEVWVVGNTVFYTWGQVGGAVQQASEACQAVNVGKKNEISPVGYAFYRAAEMFRKKVWEGYREATLQADGSYTFLDPPTETNIDFDNLPLSLSFYKPDNAMGPGITKKAESGKVWYARKRNGLMYVIARGDGLPKLYSRRMLRQHDDEQNTPLTWDDRFGHILWEAAKVMPPNSILLGELVKDKDGCDDFAFVQSITKSLTNQSLEDQEKGGRPQFYVWDVAFWNGQDLVKSSPVKDRYELIHEIGGEVLIPVQYFDSSAFPTIQEAVAVAKNNNWEGFVVVDPEGVYGDKAYNFKGKPDRPGSVCAKLKPNYEDDFIALWNPDNKITDPPLNALVYEKAKNATVGGRSKKGRYSGGIESVALFQYNSKGELVYISNVSSGMTEEMKRDWAKPEMFPMVWKVEYKGRRYMSQDDETNALDFASFLEVRTDKKPEECVNQDL